MLKTLSFYLQKGGIGKTTICGTYACEAAINGKKTLIIDCDPQGNISSWFLNKSVKYELADVLQGRCYIKDAIVKLDNLENLYILPTFGINGDLKNYSETKLLDEPFIFQDLVSEIINDFDYICLDLSPGLGRLEKAALIASNEIITPMTSEIFSLDGLEIFIEELKKLKKNLRCKIEHSRIIINSFDTRIKQHKDIYNAALSSGNFKIYLITVDPIFRKSQENHTIPQLLKINSRGMKANTRKTFNDLYKDIGR